MRYGTVSRAYFFFFQAEDGIRDLTVTGVQTCALPICARRHWRPARRPAPGGPAAFGRGAARAPLRAGGVRSLHGGADRKSTRLNSSHSQISYAVFCLKKKKYNTT